MFLKQEKSEMDDFERKVNFGSKVKILRKILIFKENILKNVFNGIFLNILFFQNILIYFEKKTYIF